MFPNTQLAREVGVTSLDSIFDRREQAMAETMKRMSEVET